IGRRRPAAFFGRSVIRAARGVRLNLIRGTPYDVHVTPVRLPSWNSRSIVLIGISDAAVVLFLEIVVRQVGIAAAPQPKLFNELLALFVRLQLQKSGPLFRRDNVDHVLA